MLLAACSRSVCETLDDGTRRPHFLGVAVALERGGAVTIVSRQNHRAASGLRRRRTAEVRVCAPDRTVVIHVDHLEVGVEAELSELNECRRGDEEEEGLRGVRCARNERRMSIASLQTGCARGAGRKARRRCSTRRC